MGADRDAYAAREAALLAALLGGHAPPAGFARAQADAAGRTLRRKRARAVRRAWPALAVALGERFGERFDAFARTQPPPACGAGLADGLAFATSRFARGALGDDVRVEIALARAAVVLRSGRWRPRRGVFAAVLALTAPYPRLLVVVRLPRLGVRRAAWPRRTSGRARGRGAPRGGAAPRRSACGSSGPSRP